MKARSIPTLALDSYQRAARVALSNHLVTRTYPDRIALPLLRRWATELREDMLELFGYRLEVTETTARLYPVLDRLDPTQPARTGNDRIFDRRRYSFLALALAALGRAGDQITLSELADHVAAEANRVVGVDLDTARAADRDAFVDAVGWLAARGAIGLADGDAGGWVSNPDAGEALYDIDRAVVVALFRPPRALQHLRSVMGLLTGPSDEPGEAARRARRALVELPVVYGMDGMDPRSVEDVQLFTGLAVERRAEGLALIDTSGRLSDTRFPSTGTVAQVALLLAGEIAERVLDPDSPDRQDHPIDTDPTVHLVVALDDAIPEDGVFDNLLDVPDDPSSAQVRATEPVRYPFVPDSWTADTVERLVDAYGRTFAAQWQSDREGLRAAAVALLSKLSLVAPAPGGVVALPALARYRGVVVTVRERSAEPDLFEESSS
ncbi:hypothetical protein GCM10007304_25160 [Rhodococcoides trifolii]|uniref:TIGR02678 family protein n=1 Tax=Rhodococcoides trifolii TaxID=908250 RepID=A0A917D4I9_9NOCA|nr:DUF2398 family protein [Rhodococcus trifolii]GGG10015.1 hypothetical protein GCM10007304_25160 [Rhodococcus trifolii]